MSPMFVPRPFIYALIDDARNFDAADDEIVCVQGELLLALHLNSQALAGARKRASRR